MIIVGFNTSALKSGHKTRGIGFYTANLLDEFTKNPDIKIIEFEDVARLRGVDLVHYPYFDLFFRTLPNTKRFPTVVTIHDVIPLIFPEHYPPGVKGRLNLFFQRQALKSVDAVITDSFTSKKDIIKYLKVKEEKIYVVYLAAAKHYRVIKDKYLLQRIKKQYHLPDKYALFTGSVNWNKNLVNMTKGCIEAGIDLVIVGKNFEDRSNLNHPERKSYAGFLASYANHPKVHILGFVPNEDLVAITNLAAVCLLLSHYEGFGLPILEAQSCGIPVIAGNNSSMMEISGRGAMLVETNDYQAIAQTIESLRDDTQLRQRLIKNGFENVSRFSWEKTAEQTLKIYEQNIRSTT